MVIPPRPPPVALSALGYFACYAPYAAITKALTKGLWPGLPALSGMEVLASSVLASLSGGILFLLLTGWWRPASRRRVLGIDLPVPRRATFLSGICTTVVVLTTTLAYTIPSVSIVFMMLLMRGGVLILAPIVDRLTGRRVMRWSWVSLGLSLTALLCGLGGAGFALPLVAAADASLYLLAYFLRLRWMSRLAKTQDSNDTLRFFAEEQLVAVPVAAALLGLVAAIHSGELGAHLREGFLHPSLPAVLVGLLSMGTGIFGALVLLDHRENSLTVPLNRCSSVLAGLVSTVVLWRVLELSPPPASEWLGAGLIVLAIGALSWPTLAARRAPE
jgi:hypothetical protein